MRLAPSYSALESTSSRSVFHSLHLVGTLSCVCSSRYRCRKVLLTTFLDLPPLATLLIRAASNGPCWSVAHAFRGKYSGFCERAAFRYFEQILKGEEVFLQFDFDSDKLRLPKAVELSCLQIKATAPDRPEPHTLRILFCLSLSWAVFLSHSFKVHRIIYNTNFLPESPWSWVADHHSGGRRSLCIICVGLRS